MADKTATELYNPLAEWREGIDYLDKSIVQLIALRLQKALLLGKLKEYHGIPLYDPEREVEVLHNIENYAREAGLTQEQTRKIVLAYKHCIIRYAGTVRSQNS